MDSKDKQREYLITRKEANSWFIGFGIVYVVAVIEAIILVASEISVFGRFLNIINFTMIPTVLIFSLPPYKKANVMAYENPELKGLKTKGTKTPASARLIRFGVLALLLTIFTALFFKMYNEGMAEKEKSSYYIINHND